MLKKVAIFSRALLANGATKSLVELLKRLDLSECNIILYVLDSFNAVEWTKSIPTGIHIRSVPQYKFDIVSLCRIIKHPFHFIKAIYAGIKLKGSISFLQSAKYCAWRLPKIDEQYDIAISYRHYDIDPFFVYNNIQANMKLMWVHGIQELDDLDIKELSSLYSDYDKIFTVSNAVRDYLISCFPKIQPKCSVAYCVVDEVEIRQLAISGPFLPTLSSDHKIINILTVGRLSWEKGMLLAYDACRILKLNRINVKWYIVGDGPQKKELQEKIKADKMENDFILLGMIENPYGLMASCDIYVQPSIYEAYGLTVNEVKVFHKPIVCTDIPAFREQIVDQHNGLLSQPLAKDIAKTIMRYINNKSLIQEVSSTLSRERISHFEAADILNQLLHN